MSWHFSRALVAAYSAATCSAGEPSAPSKSTNTPAELSCPGKMMDASNHSQSGMMSQPSMESRGVVWWMSSLADSRAKTSAWLATEKDSTVSGQDSGEKWHESLAKLDPNTSSWKTHQLSLFEGDSELLQTLPEWGMAANGELWALTCWVPTITAPASGWLPTPTCADAKNAGGRQNQYDLSRHARETTGQRLSVHYSEWTMGWPIGWTDCTQSATDKFHAWLNWHGKPSRARLGANADFRDAAK